MPVFFVRSVLFVVIMYYLLIFCVLRDLHGLLYFASMPTIEYGVPLQSLNTFCIGVTANAFARFASVEELLLILAQDSKTRTAGVSQPMILGGGSNILFTKDPPQLIIKNEIKGIEVISEDDEFIYVRAGAGENWHRFVLYCIDNGYAGIENLSLIPGCVGASPMQNIGAYGVEIKDVFHELKAFHLEERSNYTFSSNDCAFGYRESVFKNKYKNQFVILSVTFKLRKKPVYNISYGALSQELERIGVVNLSLKSVSDAVIHIRQSKLPDPGVIGNAGSFYKNPEISQSSFNDLQSRFPGIVGYSLPTGKIKLAAAWLIEHCGPSENTSWKGFRRGDAGCHQQQALVLVNYGSASGKEIYDLSEEIKQSVNGKFQVLLEREVNII